MNIRQAKQAADAIQRYWALQGVRVRAVPVLEFAAIKGKLGSHMFYTVRTDPPLVNGYPEGIDVKTARRLWHETHASPMARGRTHPDAPLW